MANRFVVPDSSPQSSPAPSTPAKRSQGFGGFSFGNDPSTTPAGPPPSSAASFTPLGAPSDSFLGSSVMRGVTGPKPAFGSQARGTPGKTLFSRGGTSNSPLGRSMGGRHLGGRAPSNLSRQYSIGDEDDEEDVDADGEDAEGEDDLPPGSLLRLSRSHRDDSNDLDAEMEQLLEDDLAEDFEDHEEEYDESEDQEDEEEDAPADATDDADLFLNMRSDDRGYNQPRLDEEEDLMVLSVPAATNKIRKEAESLMRRSAGRNRDFEFATIAKHLYNQQEPARITEPPELILQTEDLVCRLYEEGVGPEDDAEKLDTSLSHVSAHLLRLWNNHVEELPAPEGESFVTIGPGEEAEPFQKAAYVAGLVLRIHHGHAGDSDMETPSLPATLFDWLAQDHDIFLGQASTVLHYRPSPICHTMFWNVLRVSLLRGNVTMASRLLRNVGWEHARRGPSGEKAYTGKALENVRKFAAATCEVLDQCPATKSEWDVWNSGWTLFRVQARGSLDRLRLFAEGKTASLDEAQPQSMSSMARKASSQIPWDVYENLQTVYSIVLGDAEAIVQTASDWLEATVALCGWWDDGRQAHRSLMRSASLRAAVTPALPDEYLDRLASAFHLATESDLQVNSMNPVEVALASAFEGNINAVIGFLRTWSLPIACSVAEIASLGQWLPPAEEHKPLPLGGLDVDDLALLGVSQPTSDDIQGVKDATLVVYARELAGVDQLSLSKDGWEVAIQVLGRMDLPDKSEETVGELLRDLLATLDVNSGSTVEKIWRILNDLGMIAFAEETAETFGDILAKESHRFGEALWYFALSHRTNKVRDVLNLLISYSLIQSTAYPPEKDLDDDLRDLLRKRTETLEKRAKQDLEAAQLLGRMLSGYATLRKYYELRDEQSLDTLSPSKVIELKRKAAVALVAVIASSDDNIRGGLYDETRDAVVNEDFLLALLGEATVFIQQTPSVITLEQVDVLLKAIEDLQTVGSRVYDACDEFFSLVLSSGQGLKGSTPADMLTKSTSSLSGSSYVLSGSSMLASHMQKSAGLPGKVRRGWDWRHEWLASTKGEDILRKSRLGLAKSLATLWLEDADGSAVY